MNRDTNTKKRIKMIRKMQGKDTTGEMIFGIALLTFAAVVGYILALAIKLV